MAYIINKYNGETGSAIIVEDGTINNTLDIKLVGKNYSGYGEFQNENFTWLLENFAKDTQPPRAIVGQLWYDTARQKLNINYETGKWHTLGIVEVVTNNTPPTTLSQGDLWWNATAEQLWCKGLTGHVKIGGKSSGVITEMRQSTVIADDNSSHDIIQAIVGDVTTFVISKSTAFTLNDSESLKSAGFSGDIYRGITLNGLDPLTLTSTTSGYQLWGTSSDSGKLGGLLPAEYINKTTPIFPNIANFADVGFTIGATPNERLKISNISDGTNYIPTFANVDGDTIAFKTKSGGADKLPLKLVGQNVLPGNPENSNIGSVDEPFANIYGSTFSGNSVSANSLIYDSAARLPAIEPTSGTIVMRTVDVEEFLGESCEAGSIKGVHFIGHSFFGAPADLAEKYLADTAYEVGTVVMVGGTKEVTAAQSNFQAVGVVSADPLIIMNAGLEGGTIIALKGRVPVKVIGIVNKGDRLIAADTGVARSLTSQDDSSLVFAIALADNDSNEVKLVEALVL
jgi:hypothetical protein